MIVNYTVPSFLFYLIGVYKEYFLDDGVRNYISCIKDKLGYDAQIDKHNYFQNIFYKTNRNEDKVCEFSFDGYQVNGEVRRKGYSDNCKPMSTRQEMANRNSGKINQRFEETITVSRSSETTTSSTVTISAEASASMSTVKEVGAKAGVSDTSGKEKTRRSESSTAQKWERKYVIPPFMKGVADMLQCDRLVDMPVTNSWKMRGCLLVKVNARAISDSDWKKCGDPPIATTIDNYYVLRYNNFKDEWKDDGEGGLLRTFTQHNLYTIPYTKFVRRARILSDEAAERSYCKTLRQGKHTKAIEQETMQEEDDVEEITEEEKDLSDFSWDWDISIDEGEENDDDEKEKKRKEKCKGKKSKKCKNRKKKGQPKGKKPGRKAKKGKQSRRRRTG